MPDTTDGIDKTLIGSVIQALPLNDMIAAPLHAMIQAQVSASKAYADFLTTVCIDKYGRAVSVDFEFDQITTDATGKQSTNTKKISLPLLAALELPNIGISEGTISFELTVSQSYKSHSSTAGAGSFDVKLGWGPFTVEVKGSVSHKSEQTRQTDTRAKYSIETQIKKFPPAEGLMRVIDYLTDAVTQPADSIGADGKPINGTTPLPPPTTDPKQVQAQHSQPSY